MNSYLVLGFFIGHCSGQLHLDTTQIKNETIKKEVEAYAFTSYYDAWTSLIYQLYLNGKAKEMLMNILPVESSRKGKEYDLDAHKKYNSSSELIADILPNNTFHYVKEVTKNLPNESVDFMLSVLWKNGSQPVSIGANDEDFQEVMDFFDAFKKFWSLSKYDIEPQILDLDFKSKIVEIEETLQSKMKAEREIEEKINYLNLIPFHIDQNRIKYMMEHIYNTPRNSVTAPANKELAILYLLKKFDSLGLMTMKHKFSANEAYYYNGFILEGNNAIGILPGLRWGTNKDEPVIVGAHLDTVEDSPGVDDNGSGVASVIEIAHSITKSDCVFENSIFFVGFDLEEVGLQGSIMFVQEILVKLFATKFQWRKIRGALILDCVSNWNIEENSQEFPDRWESALSNLTQTEKRGDFTAIVFRKNVDDIVAKSFQKYYKDLNNPKFRLELVGAEELPETRPHGNIIHRNMNFLRSDHSRFWYFNETDLIKTIPTILITDTGPYRGRMKECYHSNCDSTFEDFHNFEFIRKITEAAVWTVADLANGTCGYKNKITIPNVFQLDNKMRNISEELFWSSMNDILKTISSITPWL